MLIQVTIDFSMSLTLGHNCKIVIGITTRNIQPWLNPERECNNVNITISINFNYIRFGTSRILFLAFKGYVNDSNIRLLRSIQNLRNYRPR